MISRRRRAFALPAIVISSVIMLTVLVASISSVSSIRSSILSQYYTNIAKAAADAGSEYAQSCLADNGGVALWDDDNPLKPDTDCYGMQLASCPASPEDAACHYLVFHDNIRSTFSIGSPTTFSSGRARLVTSRGYADLLRDSDKSTWRQYQQVTEYSQKATSLPSSPINLAASFLAGGVNLTWTAPADNGGASITNYKVYRGTSSGSEVFLANTPNASTAYVDSTGTGGNTYYYKVSAVSADGEGGQSNEASATVPSLIASFAKEYGVDGTYGYNALSIVQASDYGYAVAGNASSNGGDFFIAKFTNNGTVSWAKTLGSSGDDAYYGIVQTSDGGFIAAGYTNSSYATAGGYDEIISKFDSSGNLLWSKNWGTSGNEYTTKMTATADGGFAVTGITSGYGQGGNDVFVLKYDSSANLSWARTWGGSSMDYPEDITMTADGGVLVSGYSSSFSGGNGNDAFVLKYDSAGGFLGTVSWGSTGSDDADAIKETPDGGFIVSGCTTSYSAGENDAMLLKFDSDINFTWMRTLSGSQVDNANTVVLSSDGGYVAGGITQSNSVGSADVLLFKYDASGNFVWQKTYGGTSWDASDGLIQTADGGYAVAASVVSFGFGDMNATILKYKSDGTITGCSGTVCINSNLTNTSRTVSPYWPSGVSATPTPTTSGTPTVAVVANLTATLNTDTIAAPAY